MSDFVDIAARVMTASEQRLERIAANVSNSATPGFKRQSVFQIAMPSAPPSAEPANSETSELQLSVKRDLTSGALRATGRPFDLAIEGEGFFSLRSETGFFLTRAGQFQRTEDGRLVSLQGYALQDAGGGDVVVATGDLKVLADGTLLEDGLPTGRIGLMALDDPSSLGESGGSLFALPPGADAGAPATGRVRQGMLEGANVAMPAEMLDMMQAVRQAETGARLIQLYDTLMGRAISTFGQRG